MTSGKNHDKATKLLSIPFGLFVGVLFDFKSGFIGSIAFLIGGLWLSPDLDTTSIALRRWGIFKWFWWAYRKLIPHRSFFSHGPIIGTILRVAYVIFIISLLLLLIEPFDTKAFPIAVKGMQELIEHQPKACLVALLGIEASAWLHLIQDGDPLPIEFKHWGKH